MSIYLNLKREPTGEEVQGARILLQELGFGIEMGKEYIPGVVHFWTGEKDLFAYVGISHPKTQLDLPTEKFDCISQENAQKVITGLIKILNPLSWGAPHIGEVDLTETYESVYQFGDLPKRET